MTINEAISMLRSILKDRDKQPFDGGSGNDALKLGIEALKYKKWVRDHKHAILAQATITEPPGLFDLLSGETE